MIRAPETACFARLWLWARSSQNRTCRRMGRQVNPGSLHAKKLFAAAAPAADAGVVIDVSKVETPDWGMGASTRGR